MADRRSTDRGAFVELDLDRADDPVRATLTVRAFAVLINFHFRRDRELQIGRRGQTSTSTCRSPAMLGPSFLAAVHGHGDHMA